MYHYNLQKTYKKLMSGDKKYLNIMTKIVEYKVTKGRKQSEVKVYLNTKNSIRRFVIYISLLASLSLGTIFFIIGSNLIEKSLIFSMIPSVILLYAAYQVIHVVKYLELSEIYKNINDYVDTLDYNMLVREYKKFVKARKK